MKEDGEYARDQGNWWHRVASLVVVLCWVAAAWCWGGWTFAMRAGISLMVPGAMVWFPEVLGSLDNDVVAQARARYIGPCHPKVIRWVGWFFLLAGPGVFTLFVRRI